MDRGQQNSFRIGEAERIGQSRQQYQPHPGPGRLTLAVFVPLTHPTYWFKGTKGRNLNGMRPPYSKLAQN